ncbi:MAG TPA: HAMP domain-containing sensor histidine kinase [Bacillales bacterium]|nr:HAMP domain-containing sensor histidine kinase [Bacillales bacterium]
MFNQVKTKLTILFTLSLLCLLIIFIGLLYYLISREINDKEAGELLLYFKEEKSDFIEDLYENERLRLKYDPNQTMFYYVFNQQGEFVYGKETIQYLYSWIEQNEKTNNVDSFTKRADFKQNHLILIKKPLKINEYTHGFVILGMDITGEKHLIQKIAWTLIVLTLLFSLVYAFLGNYFAGQVIKPIKNAFHKQEQFVSDASHELRTPLSIFYSSIDLLMKEEKDNLSPFGKEVLQDAKTEVSLMKGLINHLLFLARNDRNQLLYEMKKINLSDLFASLSIRFSRIIPNTIQFNQIIQSEIYFTCDEVRIQQLFYILLDNALRYTKEGTITVSLTLKTEKIIITLKDTGCGISPHDLPHIFDRFYRADFAREKGGAGLGLSIAKTIVTAHGGEIYASSHKEKGSLFTVIFERENKEAS